MADGEADDVGLDLFQRAQIAVFGIEHHAHRFLQRGAGFAEIADDFRQLRKIARRQRLAGQDFRRLLADLDERRFGQKRSQAAVENQQAGVSSSHYVPGPYSQTKEFNVAHFDEWYLREVGR